MEQTAAIVFVNRTLRPNGSFIVHCSAAIPEDCPQDLLEIMATWDASLAYDDAIKRAARELLARRKAARNGHPTPNAPA